MNIRPFELSIVDEATDTMVVPLSSTEADGKAGTFEVRNQSGTALLAVDATAGTVKVNASEVTTAATTPRIAVLEETVAYDDFTDGEGAVGTYQLTAGTIPVGAIVLGTKVLVGAGFAGDVSAAMTIGDGSDVDRYNTGTLDVFTTAATGIPSTAPSGLILHTAAATPVLTVTVDADWGSVTAGSVTVSIYYIATV